MMYQLLFSLIAIGLLYLFNKKLGVYSNTSFTNEKMAIKVMQRDCPDTKTLKLNQTLFFNKSTAIFEYSQTAAGKAALSTPVFGISQAIGDVFVSRILPLNILIKAAKNIEAQGSQYCIKLNTSDLTLPQIKIKFSDTDPLYYWFLEQKILDKTTPPSQQSSPIMERS